MIGTRYKNKWRADFNSLLRSYKRVAKRRNILWDLTKFDFARLTQSACYLCGRKPHRVHKHEGKNGKTAGYKYNGIDRLDNEKGYTLENSKPCCGDCNRMKSDLGLNDFKAHVIKIVKVIL